MYVHWTIVGLSKKRVSASEKQLFGHSAWLKYCCFSAISENIAYTVLSVCFAC